MYDSELDISNSEITRNSAMGAGMASNPTRGGGLLVGSAKVRIANTSITDNVIKSDDVTGGAGLEISSDGVVDLHAVYFSNGAGAPDGDGFGPGPDVYVGDAEVNLWGCAFETLPDEATWPSVVANGGSTTFKVRPSPLVPSLSFQLTNSHTPEQLRARFERGGRPNARAHRRRRLRGIRRRRPCLVLTLRLRKLLGVHPRRVRRRLRPGAVRLVPTGHGK